MCEKQLPVQGIGQHQNGECPQASCTPSVQTVTTMGQSNPSPIVQQKLENMLLLVIGGSDIQSLAKELVKVIAEAQLQSMQVTTPPLVSALASEATAPPTAGDAPPVPPVPPSSAIASTAPGLSGMPAELCTPAAMRLWRIAQDQGWVDENLQPTMSLTKAAILASVIADELKLKPRWLPFETWWQITDLPTRLARAQCYKHYCDTLKLFTETLVGE